MNNATTLLLNKHSKGDVKNHIAICV